MAKQYLREKGICLALSRKHGEKTASTVKRKLEARIGWM